MAVIFLVVAVYTFFQGKLLANLSANSSDATADAVSVDQLSEFLSTSFNDVFGVEEEDENTNNNGTSVVSKKKPATPKVNSNKPPPEDTWLIDKSSFIPADPTIIPKTINKIFFQKGSGFPPPNSMTANLKESHGSWTKMNPGYEVRYFDLDHARKYLHQHFHPVFLRAFDCLPAFAGKSDLFRMTLLYREGGFHSDWKQTCLAWHTLQNITEATDFFASYDMWDSNDFFPHKCVQNAFVGSRPQHPIVATMLKMILTNIQTSHYSHSALDATSTCLLGRAIRVSEEERNSTQFTRVAGKFVNDEKRYGGCFQWNGQLLVQHKCDDCGNAGQDWGATGNNYLQLYKQRNFYCQDAESLFRTTRGW